MHGRIQKIMSGGLGFLKTLFKFFHRGQSGPGLPFEAIGPKGSYFSSRLSITVFLRKHITTCNLPGGMQTLCPPPSGHAQCYGTGCTMHGRIQKIMSGGLGVLKTLFKFFHRGQSGPGLPFEAIGPKGSYFFSRLSITVFLRKHITTCDLPGGMQTLCPPPSGHAHAMLS